MNLAEYRQHVRMLASKRDGQPIYSASVEHASVVIEHLFSNAVRRVDILSGNLNARVYGRTTVVKEAKLFLGSSADNRLRIILEEDSPRNRRVHPLFKTCWEWPNLELRVASREVQDLYRFHFALMDGDSYRFGCDKTKPAAIAAFGHEKGAQDLDEVYEVLWDQCDPAEMIPRQC